MVRGIRVRTRASNLGLVVGMTLALLCGTGRAQSVLTTVVQPKRVRVSFIIYCEGVGISGSNLYYADAVVLEKLYHFRLKLFKYVFAMS